MTDKPITLAYGRQAPWWRINVWRVLRSTLIGTAILAPIVVVAPFAYEYYERVARWRQLSAAQAAADLVVYDDHPTRYMTLLNTSAQYTNMPWSRSGEAAVWYHTAFRTASTQAFDGGVFLHGRRANGSSRTRLVSVDIYDRLDVARAALPTTVAVDPAEAMPAMPAAASATSAIAARSATTTASPGPVHIVFRARINPRPGWGGWRELEHKALVTIATTRPCRALRLYAGQPDPNDASRFMVGYQLDDAPVGEIEGQLRSDDTVKYVVRPPGDARRPVGRSPAGAGTR